MRHIVLFLVLIAMSTSAGAQSDTPARAQPQQQSATTPPDSTHLELIKGKHPKYPPGAREDAVQGEVMVDVLINEQGKVEKAEAISGDPRLTKAAEEAVRTWEFKPWIKNGKAARVHTKLPVDFVFQENVNTVPHPVDSPAPAGNDQAGKPQRVRISAGVAQGLLLRQVRPVYLPSARRAYIQGSVLMRAVIGTDGTLKDLKAISGPIELQQAALGAVQQWRYQPYYLNGKPVEVETQIIVNFELR